MILLPEVYALCVDIPEDWFEEGDARPIPALAPLPCTSYQELLDAWTAAKIQWTDRLEVGFSLMLGVVASTKLRGDQVWIRPIGIAGTAKTTFCEAISANKEYTMPLSAQRGFHSGFSKGGKNQNLIQKMKDKTVIINEGDMLLTSPNGKQTYSEMRDLWSGFARACYRNGEEYDEEGLRTTFIIAGTPTLRSMNKSAAGDRFLDIIVYERESHSAERGLVKNVVGNFLDECIHESNGSVLTHDTPERVTAKRMTVGYVNYLRENVEPQLQRLRETGGVPDTYVENVESLGLLVAIMRTRPIGGDEDKTEKELHIRLSKQLAKLGYCTSVVLNKEEITDEVLRRLAMMAHDTSYGYTYDVACMLLDTPTTLRQLAFKLKKDEKIVREALGVLLDLEAVISTMPVARSGAFNRGEPIFKLTPMVSGLIKRVRQLMEKPSGNNRTPSHPIQLAANPG